MCSNLGHIGPEKSNRGILLSQNKLLVLCTFNCYRMIDSDPLWSNLLQPAGNHFQSGYTAFMVTSSRRRRMWWVRKANARGMHVWKGRAACARGWYTWQVIEINKKMLVTKGMNRTLSNARSVKTTKKTNKQTNNHISALCTFWKTTINVILTISWTLCLSVSGVKSLDKGITFPLWATTALQEKKVKIESINQCSTLMFLDTRHKLLAHKDKPLVQEKWRLFKT